MGARNIKAKACFCFEDDTKVKREGHPRGGREYPPTTFSEFSCQEGKSKHQEAPGSRSQAPLTLSPDQSEKGYLLLATRTSSATLKTPDLMKLSSR